MVEEKTEATGESDLKSFIEQLHLPEEQAKSVIQTIIHQQAFSGPLPPPSILAGYENVGEGFANRVIALAEKQQDHRHLLENKSVDAAIDAEKRGQHYALIVSVLIILGALYLIATGKEVYGTILAGGTLTGLAYIFITGRKKSQKSN